MEKSDQYMLSAASDDEELHRLRLLEDMHDENSKSFLLRAGLSTGMKVMEIGPGAGAVLEWMSEVVGENGVAYGVDLDPRFVKHLGSGSIKIVESKIEDLDEEEESFDLIHARYVFTHISDSSHAISKVLKLLKPGGAFVLEEPDLQTGRILKGDAQSEVAERIKQTGCYFFEKMGLNPRYGAYVGSEMVASGFKIECIEHNNHVFENGSKYKIYEEYNLKKCTTGRLVLETGLVSPEELDIFFKNDPNVIGVSYTTFSVTGRKPA